MTRKYIRRNKSISIELRSPAIQPDGTGQRRIRSTIPNLQVNPVDWEGTRVSVFSPGAKVVNDRLTQLELALHKYFQQAEGKGIVKTHEVIDIIQGKIESNDFFLHFDDFLREKESTTRLETFRGYKSLLSHINKFLQSSKYALSINTFDSRFFESFGSYLTRQGIQDRSKFRILQRLRAFANWLHSSARIQAPVKLPRFTAEKKPDHIYISEQEVRMLLLAEPITQRQVKAQVLFRWCWLTGMRYGDTQSFTNVNIQNDHIYFVNNKTQKRVVQRISPDMRMILTGFNPLPRFKYLDYYNTALKELAKAAGLDREVERVKSIGGKLVREVYPLWQVISSHDARHCFAMHGIEGGMTKEQLCMLMGDTIQVIEQNYFVRSIQALRKVADEYYNQRASMERIAQKMRKAK